MRELEVELEGLALLTPWRQVADTFSYRPQCSGRFLYQMPLSIHPPELGFQRSGVLPKFQTFLEDFLVKIIS